jgi:hypothetical protein
MHQPDETTISKGWRSGMGKVPIRQVGFSHKEWANYQPFFILLKAPDCADYW